MLLSVKNLKVEFRYDEKMTEAVGGIDFSVNDNEVVGLIGESGSGKSVTALSVMRLLPKKECTVNGNIMFDGKNLLRLDEKEILEVRGPEISMIFQEPLTSLNPVLPAGEQVREAILVHERVTKREAKIRTMCLLEKVKLSDPRRIYGSYPHLLSGGERQRVMIAMAIALKPRLLIADEPTTALDVTIQSEILELITGLRKDLEMSVLFITHDFSVINKVAERILVMKEGKLVERGKKEDIFFAPKNEYTKELLLAVPKISLAGEEKTEEREKAIAVRNLNKSFFPEKTIFEKKADRVKAVNSVNLEVKEGKTLGLVGESGSGKTTLGKLLIGLIKADSGEIIRRDTEKIMQIVFQDPYSSLDPLMRMGDIVLEGPVIRGAGRSEKESTLKDVLLKVRLNYADRFKYPHQFSGGERQRIAIARSLTVHPDILILDEPVSSLDVIIQSDILKLLKHLQKKLSLTYIFISHDLRVVEYMADDIAVMYHGEVIEKGTKLEIYRSPKHPYTKRLIKCAFG